MKKKFLAVLSLVLVACTAMLFTACGGGEFASVYETEKAVVYTDAGSKAIEGLDNYSLIDSDESFVVFTSEPTETTTPDPIENPAENWTSTATTKYVVYNVKTDAKVEVGSKVQTMSYNKTTEKYTYSLSDVEVILYEDFFVVKTTGYENEEYNTPLQSEPETSTLELASQKATLYNADMVSAGIVVESDEAISIKKVDFNNDGVIEGYAIDDKFYRIKDGVISTVGVEYEDCAISVMTANTFKVYGDYIFKQGDDEILVYSLDTLQLVNRYFMPADYVITKVLYFENGSFLIQDLYFADQYSSDYDVMMTEEGEIYKLCLETKLVSVDGKVKDVDCNYILPYAVKTYYAADYENYELGDYEVIVVADTTIENKRLTSIKPVVLAFDEDGDMDVIEEVIDNQDIKTLPIKLANGNYIVKDIAGISYLYNEDGDLLATKKLGLKTGNYYVNGDKYINASTFVEYEIPEKWNYESVKGGEIIVTKTEGTVTTYAKFVDGAVTKLFDIDSAFAGPAEGATSYTLAKGYNEVYAIATVVKDGNAWKANVSIYSYSGVLLETINDVVNFVEQSDIIKVGDSLIFAIEVYTRAEAPAEPTKTVYYRVG